MVKRELNGEKFATDNEAVCRRADGCVHAKRWAVEQHRGGAEFADERKRVRRFPG